MSPGSLTIPFITLKCFSSLNTANELYKYIPDNNKILKIIVVISAFLLLSFSLNFCNFRELCLFNSPPPGKFVLHNLSPLFSVNYLFNIPFLSQRDVNFVHPMGINFYYLKYTAYFSQFFSLFVIY